MTFTIKTRGSGGLIVAEYDCPSCGRIEQLVQRDENGDPPETVTCGQVFDCGEAFAAKYGIAKCDQYATWTISAPKTRVLSVMPTAAIRGGDMKDRPPGMLDTRPLAEGMPMSEWKAKQREGQRARRHKMLTDKGVIPRKIQVGGG